jgi:uncharacterized membrane protein YdbT with pleckstrin-like domain
VLAQRLGFKGYVEPVLRRDERVVQRAQLHWIIYAPSFGLILASVVILAFALGEDAPEVRGFGMLLAFVGLLVWLICWIIRVTTRIAVTSQRVTVTRGLIQRSTMEMNASQIENV